MSDTETFRNYGFARGSNAEHAAPGRTWVVDDFLSDLASHHSCTRFDAEFLEATREAHAGGYAEGQVLVRLVRAQRKA